MTFIPPTEAMKIEDVTITGGYASVQSNNLVIESSATITMGESALTEAKLQHLEVLNEQA